MPFPSRYTRRGAPLAGAALVALGLAGCSSGPATAPVSKGEGLYQSQSAPGAVLDRQAAAAMVSELRRGKGLPPVTLDVTLNRMADEQAAAMARTHKLSHESSAGTFKQRIAKSGYRNGGMWENVGAGHDTLADAFTGWRSSPTHLKNMLQPKAERMGIAVARAPGSRFEVFWTLVLADPNDPRPQVVALGPAAQRDEAAGAPRAETPAADGEAAAAAARSIPQFRTGAPGQIFVGGGVP